MSWFETRRRTWARSPARRNAGAATENVIFAFVPNSPVPSPKRPRVSTATADTFHVVWFAGSRNETVARPSASVRTRAFQYAVSSSFLSFLSGFVAAIQKFGRKRRARRSP